jgi:hypothetical protein
LRDCGWLVIDIIACTVPVPEGVDVPEPLQRGVDVPEPSQRGLILKDDGTVKTREMHGFVYYAKRTYRSGGASRVSWVKWYKV